MSKDFFLLPLSDRKALLFLLLIGAPVVTLFFILGNNNATTPFSPFDTLAVQQPALQGYSHTYGHRATAEPYADPATKAPERFVFDPNTADSTQLLRLGLQPWMVRNIYKYRQRGGVYRNASDFARTYGLTQKQFRELQPYIKISDDYLPAAQRYGHLNEENTTDGEETAAFSPKLKPGETIPLNASDTTLLKRVPGIGPYFARQIDTYRHRLGGFCDRHQLLEIENFPAEAIGYFEEKGEPLTKIAINKLTLNQLRRHPYINFYQAKAITDYRRLRGDISDISQLSLLEEFSSRDINRLAPYVEY